MVFNEYFSLATEGMGGENGKGREVERKGGRE